MRRIIDWWRRFLEGFYMPFFGISVPEDEEEGKDATNEPQD